MDFERTASERREPSKLETLRDAISSISRTIAVLETNDDHLIVLVGGIVPEDETKMIERIKSRGGTVEILQKKESEEYAPAASYRLKVTVTEHE